MEFNLQPLTINLIIGMVATVVLFAAVDFLLFKLFNRKTVLLYTIIGEVLLLLSWYFCTEIFTISIALALLVGVMAFIIANLSDIRIFIANNMKGKAKGFFAKAKESKNPEVLFDREAMYSKIENAVVTMSKQQVGAIITFEKKDSLDAYLKSGTLLNAPVSSELLQTIFYEGTRLHDGAVVIRNNTILAASVFFTPTTRPLAGKYGSRHRAAIGVSEASDSVTVVVSEETGRISIAYDGELIHCSIDNFLATFTEYMAKAKTEEEDE